MCVKNTFFLARSKTAMSNSRKINLTSIDRICDAFESDWIKGHPSPVEKVLEESDFDDRDFLLEELLMLEIEYRMDSQQPPLRDEYLARFSNDSKIVERVFDQIERKYSTVNRLADETKTGLPTSGDAPNHLKASDRFEIISEHAAGGLGKIFVASDREVTRQVAVKKLHANQARNFESRRRFQREADITGSLEHPGIVPIYSAGLDEQGAPYYAMRFVSGETLQSAIEEFHSKVSKTGAMDGGDLQKLLLRFLDVCNTVGYAHSRGVIHRDLKPANIVLGEFGETQIIDWGMAKRIDDAEERSEANSDEEKDEGDLASASDQPIDTQQGSVFGTPAYMSPEQAAGDISNLSYTSDIYSLGATLYHLLTGQAPLQKQILSDVIDRIKIGDIPQAREIRPFVPKPLNAICVKAMNLKPGQRYATATELAEELENYLADEPVNAYREPWTKKLARWTHRHRTLVTTASVAAIVLFVTALIALVLVNGAKERERSAKQLAEQRNKQAKIYFRQARKAVDDYLGKIQSDRKLKGQGLDELRKELLRSAMLFYRDLAKREPDDPDLKLDFVVALGNLSTIHKELGEIDEALARLLEGRTAGQKLLAEQPSDIDVQSALAKMDAQLAGIYRLQGKHEDARKLYNSAIDQFQALANVVTDGQQHQESYIAALMNLGDLHISIEQFEPALEFLDKAAEVLSSLDGSNANRQIMKAGIAERRATCHALSNQPEKAKSYYRDSIELTQALCKAYPDDLDFALDLVVAYANYIQEFRDASELKPLADEVIERFEPMLKIHGRNMQLRASMSVVYRQVGEIMGDSGDLDRERSVELYERAISLLDSIVTEHPGLVDYSRALAYSHYRLGEFLRTSDEAKMEPHLLKAIELYDQLDQSRLDVQHTSAYCRYVLSIYYHDEDRLKEIQALAAKALPMYSELVKRLPDDDAIIAQKFSLFEVYYLALWNSGKKQEAVEQVNEALKTAKLAAEVAKGGRLSELQQRIQQLEADLKLFGKQ